MEDNRTMTTITKLQSLRLADDAMLTLTYEEGADVFHYTGNEVEDAIGETSVIQEFASLISDSKLDARNSWHGNILEYLRGEDLLEDYERGSGNFDEYLAEVLTDNFYDIDMIEHSTEKYDHKRGFTTLTAEVQVPASNYLEVVPFITGWTISVETEVGTVTIDT